MYEAFYNFTEKPFSLTPDPGFLYLSKKHGTGLTMLEYGLANRSGITVLTGEIGSGKTTLIRALLDELDDELVVGLISNTHESFGNLLQWVATAFDLPSEDAGKAALYDNFAAFLIENYAHGKRTVLIIDEAQNLDIAALEELRLLTNINADKDQVLQLILVGQPELRGRLRDPGLAQFVQRIGVDFHLTPLAAEETAAYITHRVTRAGGSPALFDPVACRFVHLQTGGVPRLINALCDTALVYAFADSATTVSASLLHDIVLERLEAGLFGAGLTHDAAEPPDPATARATVGELLNRARQEVADADGAATEKLKRVK